MTPDFGQRLTNDAGKGRLMIGRPFLLGFEVVLASEKYFLFLMEEKLKFCRLMVVMCFPLTQRILRVSCGAAFVLVTLCGKVLGCSGPHAGEAIAANHSIVNWWGVVAILMFAGIVALYFIRGRVGIPAILLAIVAGFLHPMWLYGGGGGDCGQRFVALAKYVTIALAGLFLLQAALWRFLRPRLVALRT